MRTRTATNKRKRPRRKQEQNSIFNVIYKVNFTRYTMWHQKRLQLQINGLESRQRLPKYRPKKQTEVCTVADWRLRQTTKTHTFLLLYPFTLRFIFTYKFINILYVKYIRIQCVFSRFRLYMYMDIFPFWDEIKNWLVDYVHGKVIND